MASDLGKSYKLKKIIINYPNGDEYEVTQCAKIEILYF